MSEVPVTVRFIAAVPQFTVPDVVRTAEYYRNVLGFQIAGYWDGEGVSFATDPPPVFAIVCRDQIQMFFSRADEPEVRVRPTEGAPDAYLRVTGIDAVGATARPASTLAFGVEKKLFGGARVEAQDQTY